MTDEEYIREAVNLADGWKVEGFKLGYTQLPAQDTGVWFRTTYQPAIDALAAQLVKQVDNKKGFRIEIYERSSGIYHRQ